MAHLRRAPYSPPSHPDSAMRRSLYSGKTIVFLHPGYDDGSNIIVALPALDHVDGAIHHETARIACAIVASNQWAQAFFTETRTGLPVSAGADEYYFRVSDNPAEKYPLVPSFAHWRFPHRHLPAFWCNAVAAIPPTPVDRRSQQGDLTSVLSARDRSCRLTAHVEGTENAHLIPKTEATWFDENGMSRYAKAVRPDVQMINVPRNAISLRSDIHGIFDQKRFALVPKGADSPAFVVHVLVDNSPDLVDLYHNVSLQQLYDISVEYLFARFAWTIFSYAAPFFMQGVDRVLTLVSAKTVELPGNECRNKFAPPRSKSRSIGSQKRKQDDPIATAEESEDEPPRGRKRRRSFETAPSLASSFKSRDSDCSAPRTVMDDGKSFDIRSKSASAHEARTITS